MNQDTSSVPSNRLQLPVSAGTGLAQRRGPDGDHESRPGPHRHATANEARAGLKKHETVS
jgi:hypothetical protein